MVDEQAERAVEAKFEIVSFEETEYDGPKLTRVRIQKRYQGTIADRAMEREFQGLILVYTL
jgi:hypothetical protein